MRTKIRTLLAACSLLVGCGSPYSNGTPQQGPCTNDSFQIDAHTPIQLPADTYGITTDGQGWVLAWQGNFSSRHFTGQVCLPAGCVFEYARFDNATLGDSVTIASNCMTFDAITDHNLPQNLLFSTRCQPVLFDLQINGGDAIGSTVFPSMRRMATTDTMPFCLVPDVSSFSAELPRAPEFTMPVGATTRTVNAPGNSSKLSQ
jgi:hypothetical protein